MQSQEFNVIYDILREGYLGLSWFIILWFLGSLIMSIIFFLNLKSNKFKVEGMNDGLGIIVFPIFLIVGILGILSTLHRQSTCINWAKNNDTQIVQGAISNLMTKEKHETFSVNEVKFEHREYDLTKCGYTQAKGKKLQNGEIVKITYHDDCILKLEVAK